MLSAPGATLDKRHIPVKSAECHDWARELNSEMHNTYKLTLKVTSPNGNQLRRSHLSSQAHLVSDLSETLQIAKTRSIEVEVDTHCFLVYTLF